MARRGTKENYPRMRPAASWSEPFDSRAALWFRAMRNRLISPRDIHLCIYSEGKSQFVQCLSFVNVITGFLCLASIMVNDRLSILQLFYEPSMSDIGECGHVGSKYIIDLRFSFGYFLST